MLKDYTPLIIGKKNNTVNTNYLLQLTLKSQNQKKTINSYKNLLNKKIYLIFIFFIFVFQLYSSNIVYATTATSLSWSGHEWTLDQYRNGVYDNTFPDNNAWVDTNGNLHIKLIYENGNWYYVTLTQKDGVKFGLFQWKVLTNISYFEEEKYGGSPNFVFSFFMLDHNLTDPEENKGEMGIESSKWGDKDVANFDWDTWKGGLKTTYNNISGSNNNYVLDWTPNYIKFSVYGPEQRYKEYIELNKSRIPIATGNMKPIIYIAETPITLPPPPSKSPPYYEAEIIICNYIYFPHSSNLTDLYDNINLPENNTINAKCRGIVRQRCDYLLRDTDPGLQPVSEPMVTTNEDIYHQGLHIIASIIKKFYI